jgi:L-ascorbate metabolism protein UlaG (beta-lactamase superfamily)
MPLTRARREKNRYLNPVPTKVGGLSVMFKVGPRILFGGAARSPKRTPGPFHTERRVYGTSPRSGLRITWFGHASSLVEIDGITLLIDPVWEERAAPTQWAGPKRFFPPTLALEDLPAIDAVLLSHDHYDHLGADTIQRLARMESLRQTRWITTLGVADSGEWDGFREIGEAFGPFDLTMLEIGASDPLWSDIHMGPEGAVRTFQALGGHGLFMPIHWGLFDLALHPWQQPIESVVAVEGLKLWSPTPGMPTEVVCGEEVRSDWWR